MKATILTLLLSAALVCAGTLPEFSVKLGGKARNLADIEHLIKEYVAKQKLSFDFNDCKKRLSIDTETPDGIEVFLISRDGALALGAAIDKNATVTRCNIIPICGGAHSEGPTNQMQRTRR